MKRFFIRKDVLELKTKNPDLWNSLNGVANLFIFNDENIESLPLKVGEDELVEIKIDILDGGLPS